MTDIAPPLAPGSTLDRFDVEALIADGGMARVYRVRHRTLGTLHAFKHLHVDHPEAQARLVKEGRVQAALHHPNVVRVTDVVELPDGVGLVMDLVDGESLFTRLDRGPMAVDEALRLFGGILDGVEAAHERGILHRDLKPANVLIGPDGVPQVADFGLAKDVKEPGEGMTRAGQGMGTPGYAAPEQWADSSAVDERTDVFALGAVLYEMLAGRAPFAADTRVKVLEQTLSGTYPALQDVPPAVAAVVGKALSRDPDDRYPTVRALRGGLARAHRAEVAPERAEPAEGRTSMLAALAGLAGLAFLIIGVFALSGGSPEDTCGAWIGRVGYYNAGPILMARRGDQHVLKRQVQVRRDYPREGNDFQPGAQRCVLPAGTTIDLSADPIRVKGAVWVKVRAGDISLP